MKDPLNDGISKVELIDHMGDDLTVVNAARVSMAKESDWERPFKMVCAEDEFGRARTDWPSVKKYTGGSHLSDKDTKLISYLAKYGHWTPFSQPQVQLRIKMPIFIARQWYKHQVGFTRNEVSRRYVSDEPEVYVPEAWRLKAESVKQGSSEELVEDTNRWYTYVKDSTNELVGVYNEMIAEGICPEQARMVLPQSMYTEFVETGSLAAYARLAKLRLDPHAQREIQWYAQAVSELIEPLFPVSWPALTQ